MSKHERAFAISAPPDLIWRHLRAEVQDGIQNGHATILHEEPPHRLDLDVRLGWGLRVRYTYQLALRTQDTEVSVMVSPYGIRHALANIFSLGRGTTPYLLAVSQGLANLKAITEEDATPPIPPC